LANVVYCDTDSLWVNAAGFARLQGRIHPSKLGALKLEATHEWVTIHGPKDYVTPSGWKTKGVRQKALSVGPATWQQEKWSSLRGLLRVGNLGGPRTEVVTKTLRRAYSKGLVSKGGVCSPFRLREW
jgi:hypothetical protein